ncbi:MAG: hypothetical protein II072_10075 [Clostridia bacterium]|nr:hypothetical protein [Clostridia bacterium]
MTTKKTVSILLSIILIAAFMCSCTVAPAGNGNRSPQTLVADAASVSKTEVPTDNDNVSAETTDVQATSAPETEAQTENTEPQQAEPMTLGEGHTANFTYVGKLISADFELPDGLELRAEKGDETMFPLCISPVDGGYIYNADGKLVGCFTAYPYDESATDDDLERIYAEFRLGHWHIMLEEMYEPVADHGTVHPALTLAEAVEVKDGLTMGENERFTCDALIAFDTASHMKIEFAFFLGELTREQLITIAESIILSAEVR